ncbi:MAG: carbohydrate ABC transporter permease [candidate division KSB1 bacterium]|nr:carbohydrate ABC transporter permease [candidate division KSB1 bacterium]
MRKILLVLLMGLIAFVILIPFLWTLSTSFKPLTEVNKYPPEWLIAEMSFQPYLDMFNFLPFSQYTFNSVIIATSSMILTLFVGSLAAFAFSRFHFKGKDFLLLVFLLSQMLPGASVIIPLFQLVRKVGLYDTYLGIILTHSSVMLPFVIWLLYGFFKTIPQEVEDAALIDGCSRLGTFWKVLLPLALPGLGATALFAFLGSWNEFFFALLLAESDSARTIPVGIGLFVGEYQDVWNQMSAAAVFFSIPPLILFSLLQRTFVKGLSAGALK